MSVRAYDLLRAMTVAELRESRDFTLLGFVKWILEPLSFMFVYVFLLGVVLERDRFAFPLFLLCALLPWRYFTSVAITAMSVVTRNASLITNRPFPREVLPLVLMTAEGATFLLSFLLLVPLMTYYDIAPTIALVWLPVILLNLALLTAAAAYATTLFGLYFPDFRSAAQNLIRMTFFVSTGLVAAEAAPEGWLQTVLRVNPLSGVFDSLRAVVIDGTAPSAGWLLYPLAVGVVGLGLSLWVYRRRAPSFAKDV